MDKHAPRYIVIYNELKADILSRKYPHGTFLPTEDILTKRFNSSRTTLRKAISMLKEEHLISVRQGRGMEVISEGSFPNVFGIKRSSKFKNIDISNNYLLDGEIVSTTQGADVDMVPAEIDIARALKLEIGSMVYRLQRVKLVNDTVFAYVVNYVPASIAPGLEKFSGRIVNLYDCLKENYDIQFTKGDETVSARLSDFIESKLLNINTGDAILIFNRTAYCRKGILEYSRTIIRPDLYQLVIHIDSDPEQFEK